MIRALAAVMLLVVSLGGWLFGNQGSQTPRETWRDDSLDEWWAQRDAEHEAERAERERTTRDT